MERCVVCGKLIKDNQDYAVLNRKEFDNAGLIHRTCWSGLIKSSDEWKFAAQQKMHQTAFGVGALCLFVGYLAGWLIFAFKFGGW